MMWYVLGFIAGLSGVFGPGWERIEVERPEQWISWEMAAYLLGGVELTLGVGSTGISSHIEDELGARQQIASGTASQRNLSLGLFGGPLGSGWRVGPTAGWISQEVEMSDFSATLPSSYEPDSQEIGSQCSDPSTGEVIDCALPNSYVLGLKSFYGGVMGGYELVYGRPDLHVFAGAYLDLNLIERRRTRAQLADFVSEGTAWRLLRSGGAQFTAGFKLPQWHMGVRTTLEYDRYGRFTFARPLEFRGPVTYDEERRTYLRPRSTVESAALSTLALKISLAYLF